MGGSRFRISVAAAVVAVGVLASPGVRAAVETFLKVGDIKGESVDKTYKGWIEALSWAWGAAQNGHGFDRRHPRGPGVCVEDMRFTKLLDSASPELIVGTAFGDHYAEAEVVLRRAGEQPVEFLRIKLTDVVLSSYATGTKPGDDPMVETLTLSFRTASGQYIPQLPDGRAGTPVPFEVDATTSRCR